MWSCHGYQLCVWQPVPAPMPMPMPLPVPMPIPNSYYTQPKPAFSMYPSKPYNYSRPRYVGWEFPSPGEMKLNTDGSSRGNPGASGAGGLLRDSEGNYICGFTCNIGFATSIEAELRGIRDGLGMAWDKEISSLLVETDSTDATGLIKEADTKIHPLGSLIEECRDFLSRSWNIALIFTPREGNRCADFLSKLSHASTEPFNLLLSPPSDLLPLLADDAAGVMFLRPN